MSYVVDYADFSNLNTWHIVTYKNQKWNEIYHFPIWDWQLPDIPWGANEYGLFGTENKITDDSQNIDTQWNLYTWNGLVKKIPNSKIQVIYRNDEAEEDTTVVDLKHFSRK